MQSTAVQTQPQTEPEYVLTPTEVSGAKNGWEYATDQYGGLWKARPGQNYQFVVGKGDWRKPPVEEQCSPEAPAAPEASESITPEQVEQALEMHRPPLEMPKETPRYAFTVEGVTLAGFRGHLTVEAPTARGLVNALRHLRHLEEKALLVTEQAPTPASYPQPVPTHDGCYICSKHGEVMTPKEKQGDTWHSHNVGTEDHPIWCKGRPGKDSPGWEVTNG